MTKVFIVVMVVPYDSGPVLRVFNQYDDAIAYGEGLVFDGTIDEFDVFEREVY